MNKLTLTVQEILDLAISVGIAVDTESLPDEDEMQTEYTIAESTSTPIYSEDTDRPSFYKHISYHTESPEWGCYPLGEEVV